MFIPDVTPCPTRPACRSILYHQRCTLFTAFGSFRPRVIEHGIRVPLLGVEHVIVRFRLATDQFQVLKQVFLGGGHETAADRDDPRLLPIAEDHRSGIFAIGVRGVTIPA
jgi:hypothetical protein